MFPAENSVPQDAKEGRRSFCFQASVVKSQFIRGRSEALILVKQGRHKSWGPVDHLAVEWI